MTTIVPADLAHVIETMESWLAGEPVWPLAKIIETWGPEFEMYRKRWHRELQVKMEQAEKTVITFDNRDVVKTIMRGVSVLHLRDTWIKKFGFAIPCAELLDELAKHKLVVEVGAGSGYMTRLMLNRGIVAIGTNPVLNDYSFEHGKYAEIAPVMGKTAARMWPHAAIFCSWPTLKHTWFRQMLKAMAIGQHLVVIREDACAEESAWQYLDDCFEELRTIEIPAFDHMNDYAQVCIKKRNRSRNGTTMHP